MGRRVYLRGPLIDSRLEDFYEGGLPPASESMGRSGPGVRIEKRRAGSLWFGGVEIQGRRRCEATLGQGLPWLDLAKPSFERS